MRITGVRERVSEGYLAHIRIQFWESCARRLIQIYFYVLSTRLSREIFFQSERDRAQVNLELWRVPEDKFVTSGGERKKRNRRSLYRWKTIADRLKWQIFLLPLFLVRPENPISSTSSASVTRECPRIDSPSFHYDIIAAVSQAYSIKTRQSSYIPSWKILSCPTISNLNLSMYIYP